MGHKLLLLTRENEKYRQLLTSCHLPNVHILDDNPQNIFNADIWLAEPSLAAPILPHATNLKWMQSTFAGVDALVKPRQRRDYELTNVRGIFGPLMSEYLFGYLLAYQREHGRYKTQQAQKVWLPGSYKTLQGQNLLLLGTGSIAKHIAQTAKHFGMHVIGINRGAKPTKGFDEVDTLANLTRHLPRADAVASILPSTPETRGALNQHTLSLLKKEVVLFNLGRGDVLDLDSLYIQLIQNQQQQAILDVFNQEPLPESHPIWSLDNVVITPHIAAPSFPEQVVEIFSENYHKWIKGEELAHRVHFERGY
ncbi:D-isomer specific 2-hydroxyacid dehydrogenase, NAD-binding [Shewanella piezotolerans WP3]|uniref:D-isomer specific 2-hydroxyacid dehydrogenase, NAD-binding n=1 Tax=Shewanella piezotolerans (strain WP3 / JCM 13877) TaxID=225849 RepID=B8CIW0_SHEPW|nr:D-2-hydroxyacid dehydrogenase [Shewanella piezotolerans]ACJ27586.1 D-isomer specific 2-hydroxyacid dehydrogenase, NAD-binding [Shewanella piezotolerans WP3]